jgi:hypothetical protein
MKTCATATAIATPDAWLEIARRVLMFSFTFEPLPCRMYLALRPFRQYSYAQSRVIVVSQTTVMLQIGP